MFSLFKKAGSEKVALQDLNEKELAQVAGGHHHHHHHHHHQGSPIATLPPVTTTTTIDTGTVITIPTSSHW